MNFRFLWNRGIRRRRRRRRRRRDGSYPKSHGSIGAGEFGAGVLGHTGPVTSKRSTIALGCV
jgi:hypothetical protein